MRNFANLIWHTESKRDKQTSIEPRNEHTQKKIKNVKKIKCSQKTILIRTSANSSSVQTICLAIDLT